MLKSLTKILLLSFLSDKNINFISEKVSLITFNILFKAKIAIS